MFIANESGMRSDYHPGTTWGMNGETPVVSAIGARFGLHMLFAVSAQGQLRFIVFDGSATAETFCNYPHRLCKEIDLKITPLG